MAMTNKNQSLSNGITTIGNPNLDNNSIYQFKSISYILVAYKG
jgi:hypothetical protein